MPGRQSRNVLMRRVFAGGAAFTGLFASCYGLGSGRQTILLVGAALLLTAGGVRLLTGGLRRTPRQWLRGTGRVMEVSEPPLDFRFGRCTLQLEVDAPGLLGESVTVHDSRVPVEQWPRPGQELPVQVAADDIRKVRVLWREVHPAEVTAAAPPTWREETPAADISDDTPTVRLPAAVDPAAVDPVDFDLDNPPGPLVPGAEPGTDRPAAPSASEDSSVEPLEDSSADRPTDSGEAALDAGTSPEPSDEPVAWSLPRPRPSPRPRSATVEATDISDTGAFHGIGFTVLVSDLPRSVTFYRDTLGFTEVDSGEDTSVLASGGTRLVLRQAGDLGAVRRRLMHLNLEVADIDRVYADLKANGVRFTSTPRAVEQTSRQELWAAAFRDPDGHGIALTQWRPASATPAPSA